MCKGFPVGSVVKIPPASSGNVGSVPSAEEKWQPIPVTLPGKSHGQRSPVVQSMGSQKSQT